MSLLTAVKWFVSLEYKVCTVLLKPQWNEDQLSCNHIFIWVWLDKVDNIVNSLGLVLFLKADAFCCFQYGYFSAWDRCCVGTESYTCCSNVSIIILQEDIVVLLK